MWYDDKRKTHFYTNRILEMNIDKIKLITDKKDLNIFSSITVVQR
jgi:hypothetical protein